MSDVRTLYRLGSGNPLLDHWRAHGDVFEGSTMTSAIYAREAAVKRYAWAVPSEEALDELAALGPVVEVLAGGGYWAWCLRQRGVDVVCYDERPYPLLNWYVDVSWVPVSRRPAHVAAAKHPDRTLFLCWPPYSEPVAYEALRAYRGYTVVYVGEEDGGCTGDEAFHRELATEWTLDREIGLPQWWGIHDTMMIYRRS